MGKRKRKKNEGMKLRVERNNEKKNSAVKDEKKLLE